MAHVLILGGGFGGLAAADTLRGLLDDGDSITLVGRSDHFYMGFAKLWDLGGMRPLDEGTASLRGLEGRGIRFLQSEIRAVDPEARTVETAEGSLSADALLVALGAGFAPAHLDLLAGENAHNLYDGAALPAMKSDLAGLQEGRVVVSILGGPFQCPPAPYEAVLIVDELLRERGVRDRVELALTTPQPITLPAAGVDASAYVAEHLAGQDIELLTEHPVAGVEDGTLRFADGSDLDYDLLLGVPASALPPVLGDSALAAPSGWIQPDRHTLATGFARVYAVGDCTLVPTATAQLPKAGVFAAGEAEVAARNIAADLNGGEAARFDGHGSCFLEVPGRRVAMVQGDFYATPEPDVELTEASEESFRAKQAFERDRLDAWLGPGS
ncbi:MAG: NAD(P)/FAD-dependent oxidoreductase [Nitriliruptorales bacterium]